ncbi:chloride channel protein [Thiohalophilus thiocyanatoxydans]|uniref:H+/Cl-antiporter ClcA n=1 Tax=Thiohalophilus thiocyanatoxydans TaxID=381308 RepID=A0A4R8IJE0_9GAMM|nr:chloride channel protein [Thiohalophilus thiocyanatoxydans]TDY00458.1 H+/Cl- antiporter ClcA [Thiohalophilus thiocyanatoxydans]
MLESGVMYRQHLKRTRRRFFTLNKWKMRLLFWGSALSVGAIAALFALAAGFADESFHHLHQQQPWLTYLLPPVGLAFIAWLTRRFFPGTEGSGIPQAIAALSMRKHALRHKVLSLRVALGKMLLTTLGLFCGASIGREGPTVHIGASLMYSLRRFAPQPLRGQDMLRALILAGGAAGISAAFNTPLAGILFAVEEMSRSFEQRTSGTLIIAVVLAGLTALVILGPYTYFGSTDATLPLSGAWLAVLICGVVGGLLGGLFATALILGSRRIAPLAWRYPVRIAFACGLLISLLGFVSDGQSFGTGYLEAQQLVDGGEASLLFPLWKLLATLSSYLSGIPGGIFAPSLAVGAGLGADLALLLPHLPVAALIMLGMVGYFSGVVQTPITAFVIVMEMTDNSGMLLPLMATALIARGVSSLVCPRPIYQALADAYLHKQDTQENAGKYENP